MRYAMEACFENGVEVVILDRPNPLGGLKVDGPRSIVNGVATLAHSKCPTFTALLLLSSLGSPSTRLAVWRHPNTFVKMANSQ